MNNEVKLLEKILFQVDNIVSKQYLENLATLPVAKHNLCEKQKNNFFLPLKKIDTISYNLHEVYLDKLTNIFNVLSGSSSSLIYVIVSDGVRCDFYLGVRDVDSIVATTNSDALTDSFIGNFPGSVFTKIRPKEIRGIIDQIFENDYKSNNCITSVSTIPSLKTDRGEPFVQGMEKFIDSMRGKKFSAIIIADSLSREQLAMCRNGYENLYTQLSPFASSDVNIGSNESSAFTAGSSVSITDGLLESITSSVGKTQTSSINQSKGENHGRNIIMDTIVSFTGGKRGTNIQEGSSEATSVATQTGENKGKQHAEAHQTLHNETKSSGSSKSIQTHIQNRTIVNILEKIDSTLKRLQLCEELGAWKCAAYFISADQKIATVAAHSYQSLMCGKDSSGEPSNINIWNDSICEATTLQDVTKYLKSFQHPQFFLSTNNDNVSTTISDPASIVSGSELSQLMGMPTKSISGLPVMTFSPFGRDVIHHATVNSCDTIGLGKIFHMGCVSETDVNIDLPSLTMHTLVTGTTGSGKSNTVYHIIDELLRKNIKILVVEPAKGEYKEVFGGRNGFKVFSTNSNISELLRINPFVFPPNIHVLEHIDKLLEIFNACWSMYAAMPSKLKQAILRCYADKGWDVEQSINYDGAVFPDFSDLLRCLPEVISESDFSAEVKGNYIGALVERTRNMTEGLEKQIFLNKPISDEELFDCNCIIDISRGLSSETKSLLMGIIVMRMYEFHTSRKAKNTMNLPLRHLTIMEEAHNLLRRTSIAQTQDGSNVQGKAVEMITNAIAEMRTYGEGFLIVDQSPSVLDESVIRNTNTKICHRLTTSEDYTLVGKSAGVTDEQLLEIPKLKDGVAVVFQNNWLQPVLCQIPKFNGAVSFIYEKPGDLNLEKREALGVLLRILLAKRCHIPEFDLTMIPNETILKSKNYFIRNTKITTANVLSLFDEFIDNHSLSIWDPSHADIIANILLSVLPISEIIPKISSSSAPKVIFDRICTNLRRVVNLNGNKLLEMSIIQFILIAQADKNPKLKSLCHFFQKEHLANDKLKEK